MKRIAIAWPRITGWLLATNEMPRLAITVGVMTAYSILPMQIVLTVLLYTPGVIDQPGSLTLGFLGKALIVTLAVGALLASIAVGAAMRLLTASFDAVSVVCIYTVPALAFVLSSTMVLRTIIELVPSFDRGDGIYVLTVTAIWVMTLGYLAKIPWDDLRDRMVKAATSPKAETSRPPRPMGGAGL